MTKRNTAVQLWIFVMLALAFAQLAALLLTVHIVFIRRGAPVLLLAVGVTSALATPFYLFALKSLRDEALPALWRTRLTVTLAVAICVYISLFAILNIYGS